MKNKLKYLSYPLLVWLITLFISAIGIMFTAGSADAGILWTFIWFLVSIPASLPAFILFLVGYHLIRKKEPSNMATKMKILGVNLINMVVYFIIIWFQSPSFILDGLWVVIPSCILIFALPLPAKPAVEKAI
jgi:hypothetical protein